MRHQGIAVAILGLFPLLPQNAPGSGPRIVVVTSSSVAAYGEALEGLKKGLGKASEAMVLVDLEAPGSRAELPETLEAGAASVAVSIGSDASRAVTSQIASVPLISTMILGTEARASRGEPPAKGRLVGAVTLEVPTSVLVAKLGKLFPGSTRLGILWNPGRSGRDPAEMRAEAQRAGFTLRTAEVAGPAQLLDGFRSLEGQVDFVWCLPDDALYTAATVKPLVIASLRNRLPLIGFSESFARAGAAIGIYPDFRDVGAQTAEMVQKYVSGGRQQLGSEAPRRVKVAVNQRVLRILGLRVELPDTQPDSLVILK